MYQRKVNLIKLNQSCRIIKTCHYHRIFKCPLTVQKQNQSGITTQLAVSVIYLFFIQFFPLVYLLQMV